MEVEVKSVHVFPPNKVRILISMRMSPHPRHQIYAATFLFPFSHYI